MVCFNGMELEEMDFRMYQFGYLFGICQWEKINGGCGF